jgi:(2Fe-2S) ferredoxin
MSRMPERVGAFDFSLPRSLPMLRFILQIRGAHRMRSRNTPYKCHIFVCTRSRNGEEKACADGDSAVVKALLKEEIKERGWKDTVRVSESGCLGLCATGPNVMIHPQGRLLSQVKPSDVPEIVKIVEQHLAQ